MVRSSPSRAAGKSPKRNSRELEGLTFGSPGPRTSFLNELIDDVHTQLGKRKRGASVSVPVQPTTKPKAQKAAKVVADAPPKGAKPARARTTKAIPEAACSNEKTKSGAKTTKARKLKDLADVSDASEQNGSCQAEECSDIAKVRSETKRLKRSPAEAAPASGAAGKVKGAGGGKGQPNRDKEARLWEKGYSSEFFHALWCVWCEEAGGKKGLRTWTHG